MMSMIAETAWQSWHKLLRHQVLVFRLERSALKHSSIVTFQELTSKAMPTPNPMEGSLDGSFPNRPLPVSMKTFIIAGIVVRVYGLDELSSAVRRVQCLWLLHPRLQSQECMGDFAAGSLNEWNQCEHKNAIGLLAVTFDQRNHGTREADPLSNQAWRSGNVRHAQDMFSIYRLHHDLVPFAW